MENGFALSSWGGFVYKSLQVSVSIQPLFLPEKVEPKVQACQMLAYPSKPMQKGELQVREVHLVSIFSVGFCLHFCQVVKLFVSRALLDSCCRR